MPSIEQPSVWRSVWPDLLGFAVGLGVARWAGWTSGDLVWSLWLSSLVVGYAIIFWIIAQGAESLGSPLAMGGAVLVLAFFTVHFAGFHYVQSEFLIDFFPIKAGTRQLTGIHLATYAEVVRRYWPFLPSAFMAHRNAFRRQPLLSMLVGADNQGGRARALSSPFSEPYRNVARMHLLIFFFFIVHFLGVENFGVYAVVYAVYFFPWRLLRGSGASSYEGAAIFQSISPTIDRRTPVG